MAAVTPGFGDHGRADWPAASLLGRVPPEVRDTLLRAGTRVTYTAQDHLLHQGEFGDHAILLVEGCVKVIAYAESGARTLLAVRLRGDIVGDMSVLDGRPRAASVTAATPIVGRRIGRAQLLQLVRQRPDVGIALTSLANQRLRWANQRRVDFVSLAPAARVARVMLEVAETYGEAGEAGVLLDISLTQRDLATLAGVSLPVFERALSKLRQDGLVRPAYCRLLVTDLPGLRSRYES